MMERAEILSAMADPKPFAMRAACEEPRASAVRRQHEPQRVVSDLLAAGINESEPLCAIGSRTMASARSVKCLITGARLPVAREIEEFTFDGTPTNEAQVARSGAWRVPEAAAQRRAGRRDGHGQDPHLGRHRAGVRHWARTNGASMAHSATGPGAFGISLEPMVFDASLFDVVDLVNRLQAEARAGRAGRLAEQLMRLDFVVLDVPGYLPFAQST